MTDDGRGSGQGPLIGEHSMFFAIVTAVTLLVAGIAGVARQPAEPTAASTAMAAHDHAADHDHAAEDASGSGHEHGTGAAGEDHADGHDHTAAGAASSGDARDDDGHVHGAAGSHAAPLAENGSTDHADGHEHGAGPSGGSSGTEPTTAHEHDGEAPEHEHGGTSGSVSDDHGDHGDQGDATGDAHGDHGAGAPAAHGGHGAGCSDDHPATKALVAKVQFALEELYPDAPTLVARGYIPYFDALFPTGWPATRNGISHWLQPHYIDDGVLLDPLRPEAVLLDEWRRPIGMMFIADPDEPAPPVYTNADGEVCSPWHPHTDYPARFGWWFYRTVYDDAAQEGDVALPDQTPEMMHVWAIDNPHGAYEAHRYPPRENRQGPPGPTPSYVAGSDLERLGAELVHLPA